MRRLALAALLFLLPVAAPADDAYDTAAGRVEIVGDNGAKQLRVGDRLYDVPTDPWYAFLEARVDDDILVLVSEGGNACHGFYTWFHAVPGTEGFSPVFGSCSLAEDVGRRGDALVVTMFNRAPGSPPITYVWDGARLTEEDAPREMSGMGPGDGPDFWLGRYPFDYLRAADTRAGLARFMDSAALTEADRLVELASPFAREGGWIVGYGCIKWSCEGDYGVIALGPDGQVLVALHASGEAPVLYGAAGGPLPGRIVELLADR